MNTATTHVATAPPRGAAPDPPRVPHPVRVLDAATLKLQACESHEACRDVWRNPAVRGVLAVRREGRVVGVLERPRKPKAGPVSRHMLPLDEARLISAEAPLMDFVRVAEETHYRLVLRGTAIVGIISRSHLCKPAAGALLNGLLGEIEQEMAELIRRECGADEDAFVQLLSAGRRNLLEEKRARLEAEGAAPDRLALTELCDKREIVRKLYRLGQDFSIELRRIEMYRNSLLQANGAPATATHWSKSIENLLAAEQRLAELRRLPAGGG